MGAAYGAQSGTAASLLTLALTAGACAAPGAHPRPPASTEAPSRCVEGWQHDPSVPRWVRPASVAPTDEETKRKLSSRSRWERERGLDALLPGDAPTERLRETLDALVASDPSSYVRSEAARLRSTVGAEAPRNVGGMWWTKSYARAWDAHPENLAKVVGPVRVRPAAIPPASFDAATESACLAFPGEADATLTTSRGTFVSASAGEFGCLVALYPAAASRRPRMMPMCATVFFAVREVVYGVYRLDHMDGTYELYRAAPSTADELEISSVTLPDAPRGAYALADGTLLIDTGEAVVHVDEEGIASVRSRAQVVGMSAATEGFEPVR